MIGGGGPGAARASRSRVAALDGDPQAGCEPGPRLPTEGDADRLQDGDQPWRFPGVCGDEFWQALREDAARAGSIAAEEFPHDQLDVDSTRPPGQVRQAALVAARH